MEQTGSTVFVTCNARFTVKASADEQKRLTTAYYARRGGEDHNTSIRLLNGFTQHFGHLVFSVPYADLENAIQWIEEQGHKVHVADESR